MTQVGGKKSERRKWGSQFVVISTLLLMMKLDWMR